MMLSLTNSSVFLISLVVVGIFLVYIVTRLLFLPPDELQVPVQPVFTFVLFSAWGGNIWYSIARLVSIEENKARDLANFSRNAVAGAIALSVYFLLPLEWLVNAGNRVFARALGGTAPNYGLSFAAPPNSSVIWLQTTAVPSIVAVGFVFLTAYITSLVWYEYYRVVSGAGLSSVSASRRGRDPSRNPHWFDLLDQAESRVMLVGATLGGWFYEWDKFRSGLRVCPGSCVAAA